MSKTGEVGMDTGMAKLAQESKPDGLSGTQM
jgi:hypothetical protein